MSLTSTGLIPGFAKPGLVRFRGPEWPPMTPLHCAAFGGSMELSVVRSIGCASKLEMTMPAHRTPLDSGTQAWLVLMKSVYGWAESALPNF